MLLRSAHKALAALTLGFAIVAISVPVASAETPESPLKAHLRYMHLAKNVMETPFFNAKKEELTLNDFKGQGLVVNFWATWCAPCVAEMPSLNNLSAILKDKNIKVLAISTDRLPLIKVPPFFEDYMLDSLEIYYDDRGRLSRRAGASALPTTLLIHQDGTVMGGVMGALEWDEPAVIEDIVNRLTTPRAQPAN